MITNRRINGCCARHQRKVSRAIKQVLSRWLSESRELCCHRQLRVVQRRRDKSACCRTCRTGACRCRSSRACMVAAPAQARRLNRESLPRCLMKRTLLSLPALSAKALPPLLRMNRTRLLLAQRNRRRKTMNGASWTICFRAQSRSQLPSKHEPAFALAMRLACVHLRSCVLGPPLFYNHASLSCATCWAALRACLALAARKRKPKSHPLATFKTLSLRVLQIDFREGIAHV